jgi:hypothetical protein
MVFLSLTTKFNRWLGPVLLRYGIKARYLLGGGIIVDNPLADALCLIPLAQKLIQSEVYHESKEATANLTQSLSTSNAEHSMTPKATDVSLKEIDHEVAIRLRVLERYIRPALVYNERWSDIRQWQFHSRILKWTRTQYLIARYSPTIRHLLHNSQSKSTSSIRKSPQLTGNFFGWNIRSSGSLVSNQLADTVNPLGWLMGDFNNANKELSDSKGDAMKLLPYSALLTNALGMTDWESTTKNIRAIRNDMVNIAEKLGGNIIEIRGGSIGVVHVPDDTTDVSNLSLGEILEVAGGHVMQCGPFNALCEDANIYQFWTREYVEHLGRYLLRRTAAVPMKETIILDVGAGDGVLALLLRDFFATENNVASSEFAKKNTQELRNYNSPLKTRRGGQKKKGTFRPLSQRKVDECVDTHWKKGLPTIIASDNGAWGISPIAPVEKQTVQEAIDAYSAIDDDGTNVYHIIVLCSWMPMNEDWTAIFRRHRVDEYILIGECDDGQCGDNWATWGNIRHLDDNFDAAITTGVTITTSDEHSKMEGHSITEIESNSTSLSSQSIPDAKDSMSTQSLGGNAPLPPYKVDGYERQELDDFFLHQFSRFDCRSSKTGRTVSFCRRE